MFMDRHKEKLSYLISANGWEKEMELDRTNVIFLQKNKNEHFYNESENEYVRREMLTCRTLVLQPFS